MKPDFPNGKSTVNKNSRPSSPTKTRKTFEKTLAYPYRANFSTSLSPHCLTGKTSGGKYATHQQDQNQNIQREIVVMHSRKKNSRSVEHGMRKFQWLKRFGCLWMPSLLRFNAIVHRAGENSLYTCKRKCRRVFMFH